MSTQLFFAALFVFPVAFAVISDARWMRIPNWITAVLAAAFVPFAAVTLELREAALHVLIAGLLFGAMIYPFVNNWMGAGDVKLTAAAALWAGPTSVVPMLVAISFAGCALATIVWLYWRALEARHADLQLTFPMKQLAHWGRIGRVPYGIAIGIGALAVVPRIFFS